MNCLESIFNFAFSWNRETNYNFGSERSDNDLDVVWIDKGYCPQCHKPMFKYWLFGCCCKYDTTTGCLNCETRMKKTIENNLRVSTDHASIYKKGIMEESIKNPVILKDWEIRVSSIGMNGVITEVVTEKKRKIFGRTVYGYTEFKVYFYMPNNINIIRLARGYKEGYAFELLEKKSEAYVKDHPTANSLIPFDAITSL